MEDNAKAENALHCLENNEELKSKGDIAKQLKPIAESLSEEDCSEDELNLERMLNKRTNKHNHDK